MLFSRFLQPTRSETRTVQRLLTGDSLPVCSPLHTSACTRSLGSRALQRVRTQRNSRRTTGTSVPAQDTSYVSFRATGLRCPRETEHRKVHKWSLTAPPPCHCHGNGRDAELVREFTR